MVIKRSVSNSRSRQEYFQMPETWGAKRRKCELCSMSPCNEWINFISANEQHEENFQRLQYCFWCFAAFPCKLPDGSLGTDWTRLKIQLEIEPMFADAKKEGCGIVWKLKLLCWANEDCCELVPSTATKFGAFGLKPGREACCFRWSVLEADLYELKLCRFLCRLNCATKCSGVPPSSNREMLVFRTEWLAIFFPQASWAALGKNLPIWFWPSGDSLYHQFELNLIVELKSLP